ncbi:hypothetical protein IFR05_007047 [Cadophora sp. M221]|nr:hypothetical protein IFR05_007047 [Cadophora sp. M221]
MCVNVMTKYSGFGHTITMVDYFYAADGPHARAFDEAERLDGQVPLPEGQESRADEVIRTQVHCCPNDQRVCEPKNKKGQCPDCRAGRSLPIKEEPKPPKKDPRKDMKHRSSSDKEVKFASYR